jgi:hypothetical protein
MLEVGEGRSAAGGGDAAAAEPDATDGAWRACSMARKAGESARGGEGGPIAMREHHRGW